MTTSLWTLTEQRAEASTDFVSRTALCRQHGIRGTIDLDRPQKGIVVDFDGTAAGDHLLGIDLRSEFQLAEHWVRGSDMTAVYEPVDARRLRSTAMWRLTSTAGVPPLPSGVTAWELIISAQTSLLQSDSTLSVVSEITAVDVLTPADNCVLARRHDGTTAVVIVHPDDMRRIRVDRHGPRTTISCWLFSSAVEKGVLLRSRVLAAIGPTANDTAWAAALAAAFAHSPPILTT